MLRFSTVLFLVLPPPTPLPCPSTAFSTPVCLENWQPIRLLQFFRNKFKKGRIALGSRKLVLRVSAWCFEKKTKEIIRPSASKPAFAACGCSHLVASQHTHPSHTGGSCAYAQPRDRLVVVFRWSYKTYNFLAPSFHLLGDRYRPTSSNAAVTHLPRTPQRLN